MLPATVQACCWYNLLSTQRTSSAKPPVCAMRHFCSKVPQKPTLLLLNSLSPSTGVLEATWRWRWRQDKPGSLCHSLEGSLPSAHTELLNKFKYYWVKLLRFGYWFLVTVVVVILIFKGIIFSDFPNICSQSWSNHLYDLEMGVLFMVCRSHLGDVRELGCPSRLFSRRYTQEVSTTKM